MALTIRQQLELSKALDRARMSHIAIAGRGYRRSDGAYVYAVTSASEPNRLYLVTVEEGARLACDCAAAEHGRYCKHRALIYASIAEEQRALREAERQHEAAQRESAPLHRSNRAFSLYK